MNFVIGDVHGELTKLKSLVANIRALDKNACFYFIGDYLDKGEDPYLTLYYLTELSVQQECLFLRGNHEYYWELLNSNTDEYASYLLKYGGKNTMQAVGKGASILETKEKLFSEFGIFFKKLKNFYVTDDFVLTHSGIPATSFSAALETIPTEKLLFNRYAFIQTMQLFQNKKVIFGHTGFYAPYYDGYKIGIDTAACYLPEQPLTAFCMDEKKFINSNNHITALSVIDQSVCPAIPRVKAWRQL
jgi:serine/threonine protein phosphatase 1